MVGLAVEGIVSVVCADHDPVVVAPFRVSLSERIVECSKEFGLTIVRLVLGVVAGGCGLGVVAGGCGCGCVW